MFATIFMVNKDYQKAVKNSSMPCWLGASQKTDVNFLKRLNP